MRILLTQSEDYAIMTTENWKRRVAQGKRILEENTGDEFEPESEPLVGAPDEVVSAHGHPRHAGDFDDDPPPELDFRGLDFPQQFDNDEW
jgi:hypothetical protein